MPQDKTLLVGKGLSGVRLEEMLGKGGRLARPAAPRRGDHPRVDEGRIVPGRLYPSAQHANKWFYLPRYDVARLPSGAPDVRLEFYGESSSGARGVVGKLRVGLTAAVPAAPSGGAVEETRAPITVSLRWKMRVEGADATEAWREVELGAMTRPDRLDAPVLLLREGDAEGSPPPAWLQRSFTSLESFREVYTAMSDPASDAMLVFRARVDVRTRTWKQLVVGREALAVSVQKDGVLISPTIRLDALQALRSGARTVRLDAAAGVPVAAAPLPSAEGTGAAVVAPPAPAAPDPVVVKPVTSRFNTALLGRIAGLRRVETSKPTTDATPVATLAQPVVTAAAPTLALSPVVLASINTTVIAKSVGLSAATTNASLLRDVSTTRKLKVGLVDKRITQALTASVVDEQASALTARLKVTDLTVKGASAIPTKAAVLDTGEPALIDVVVEGSWQVAFGFPLGGDESAAVYGTGTTGLDLAPTVLRALSVVDDVGVTIPGLYQESLAPERIHIVPRQLRIARGGEAPWLPALSVVAGDFLTQEGEDVRPVCRVSVAYALEPFVPEDLYRRVSERLGQLNPPIAPLFLQARCTGERLRLQLPWSAEAAERADVRFDADLRMTDTLDLSEEEFSRFVQVLTQSGGVEGQVQLQLLDGASTAVPVHLSLGLPALGLVDVSVVSRESEAPLRYRVRIRNRIESDIRLIELRSVSLGGTGLAFPVEPPLQSTLAPQRTVEVLYEVNGDEDLFDPDSIQVVAQPFPDAEALLRMLIVPSGFESRASSVRVVAHFPATEAATPLVGLRVEFNDGTVITLTPDDPEEEITLLGDLLDTVLQRPPGERSFFFRVQNLHPDGEGAQSGWMREPFKERLDVAPIVATMPAEF